MLATPWEQRKSAYDFVIIGSGYGGAISAARLASANLNPKPSICILERGKEWQPGSFPETGVEVLGALRSDPNPLGLYELLNYPDISVIKGSGLGGTSLINANVAIVPDREVFEAAALACLHHLRRAAAVLPARVTGAGGESAPARAGVGKGAGARPARARTRHACRAAEHRRQLHDRRAESIRREPEAVHQLRQLRDPAAMWARRTRCT